MNESAIKQTATARIESLLAQQELMTAAMKEEVRALCEHNKRLVKLSPEGEEKRATIEGYKERLAAIKKQIAQPDNGQMILNLAGPDYAPLGGQ